MKVINIFKLRKLSNNVETERVITPHYKSLKKKYAKENNQIFFRESLDGKISLWGDDYDFVNNASIEDTLYLDVYQNGKLYMTNEFNKTDCKFDHFKQSVELKLTARDKYSDILDKYDNTYDLIKLAPATSSLQLTKRVLIQIYTRGEATVTNFFSGAYWEAEVSERIDNENDLTKKYHFAKCENAYQEIHLEGFNYGQLNTTFRVMKNSLIWNSSGKQTSNDGSQYDRCSIVLIKIYSSGDIINAENDIYLMSTGQKGGYSASADGAIVNYDCYAFSIYSEADGKGRKLYESRYTYANDDNFNIILGGSFIEMLAIEQSSPYKQPEPASFYLSNNVINYDIYARVLFDTETYIDGYGTVYEGYDIPYDDFATVRANLKKCIGLQLTDAKNAVFKLIHTDISSDEPTSYGQTDYDTYFRIPAGMWFHDFIPVNRSSWANTSLWVYLMDKAYSSISFEEWCSRNYKQYMLKDAFMIADVIKAMLKKIAPDIIHEATIEYSRFLYKADTDLVAVNEPSLSGYRIYITPKSNILKGEYDQPAQKAEITFEQLMNMLRDCFKCYWFVDEQNKFRIEHVSYFLNGMTYEANKANVLDLTKHIDKFNKKPILYDQQEVNYEKSDLASRYEFNWMDDVTEPMGDLQMNIKSKYVQKDKTESINAEVFTPDIDFMLMNPDEFSQDGFALILAKDGIVPIVDTGDLLINTKQYNLPLRSYAQNFYASWKNLYKYYLWDLPGKPIELEGIKYMAYPMAYIKRSMQHEIQYQMEDDPNINELIKTYIGNGFIEDINVDIDTRLITTTLSYEPR